MESWDYFQALLTRDDFSRDLNDGLSSIKVHVRGGGGMSTFMGLRVLS